MNDQSSQITSPKSVESSSTSKFKTLKKKIKNKFRLSRTEDVKTIAQAVETLRRSDELIFNTSENGDQLKIEFKGKNIYNTQFIYQLINFNYTLELKETLESIVNQNQVLAEAVKSVDSCCPDPFNEPEKFTVYLAQKSFQSRSLSDEFGEEEPKIPIIISGNHVESGNSDVCLEAGHPLLRLQNLRMEEQRSFAIERENYETQLKQIGILHKEIEILRKQNSDHEIELEFLKSQNSQKSQKSISESESAEKNLKNELEELHKKHALELEEKDRILDEKSVKIFELDEEIKTLKIKNEELSEQGALKDSELKEISRTVQELNEKMREFEQIQLPEDVEDEAVADVDENHLMGENDNLKNQLEEKEIEFGEILEENARLKIEFNDLKQELKKLETEFANLEVNPKGLCAYYLFISCCRRNLSLQLI